MTRNARNETQHRLAGERTYSREQRALQKEFCDAYGFAVQQIGFDGKSLDPIFDFDALAVLSTRLCNLPHVDVDFGKIEPTIQMATSRAYAILPNNNTRKIFGTAVVGEVMHDGTRIETIHQAVKVSRARALRTILRAVGFDPVAAHRAFRKTGHVVELQGAAKSDRQSQSAEIHLHASDLGLIKRAPNGRVDRTDYETKLAIFFKGKTSSEQLTEEQRADWLGMLRAWSRARAVIQDGSQTNAA